MQLHDQSLTSYDIFTTKGYDKLIPSGTPLPYSETQTFQTVFDYIDRATFKIYHRKSMLDIPMEITTVELVNIRVTKKGDSKVKAIITLDKDLISNFTV
jgi:molecular chaperone DnaK (HSP70)